MDRPSCAFVTVSLGGRSPRLADGKVVWWSLEGDRRRRRAAATRTARCMASSSDRSEPSEPSMPSGDFNFDWGLMQERIAKTKQGEENRDQELAVNWKAGKSEMEVVANLEDDYVRRLHLLGTELVFGSHQGSLYFHNLRSRKRIWKRPAHRAEVTALDFDGRYIASGAVDGTVRVHHFKGSPTVMSSGVQHAGIVTAVCLAGRRGELYTASVDSRLKIWNLESGRLRQEITVASGVLCGTVAGNYVLLGCRDGSVVVYTADKGLHVLTVNCFPANVTCLQYDEESETLVVGSTSGAVKVWSLPEGKVKATMEGHQAPVMSLQWDEEKTVTAGRDGCVRAWDSKTGAPLFTIGGYTAYITSVQFDKERLITDGTNNVISQHRFWVPPKADKRG